MEVEFTARQVRISKGLRMQAEEALEGMARFVGKTASASVILGAQRHLFTAEVTIKSRSQTIVATGKGEKLIVALKEALEHAEQQVLRSRDRRLEAKRLPKGEKAQDAPPVSRTKTRAVAPDPEAEPVKPARKGRAAIAVHSFPPSQALAEPHIVKSSEAVARKPMSIEEAVKDAEFRDRDLLIFRDPSGELFVLHRRRDGQMELIELP